MTLLHFALTIYNAKCNNVIKSETKCESVCLKMNTAIVYFKQKKVLGTKNIQYFCFKKKIINNEYLAVFPGAQEQLIPQFLVGSGPNSNSFEILWCKNEEDPIKMKALEWTQAFPRFNPMGAICCHGNQSSYLICRKT